jgi:ectoine hydroxylase-related dioxygenase (phytanoyl-CoA dioxygenase family)
VQYWGLEADDIVTAWIALTPSNLSNGCMRVMPRSHLTTLSHKDTRDPNNLLTRGQEIAAEVDESKAVDLVLSPGEFSLHHERTVHGSKRNEGTERRIGFSVRYLRPTARQVVESSDSATLVRGVDRYGHFAPEPRPTTDMDPSNVAFLDQLLTRRAGGDYRR